MLCEHLVYHFQLLPGACAWHWTFPLSQNAFSSLPPTEPWGEHPCLLLGGFEDSLWDWCTGTELLGRGICMWTPHLHQSFQIVLENRSVCPRVGTCNFPTLGITGLLGFSPVSWMESSVLPAFVCLWLWVSLPGCLCLTALWVSFHKNCLSFVNSSIQLSFSCGFANVTFIF